MIPAPGFESSAAVNTANGYIALRTSATGSSGDSAVITTIRSFAVTAHQ